MFDIHVCVFRYIKGANLRSGAPIHIPGCGDNAVVSVVEYDDPCPLPTSGVSGENRNDGGRALRTLKAEHKRIYAPDCNIGNVLYEKDGVYINLPEHKVKKE